VLADVPYLTAEQLIEASKGRLSKADKWIWKLSSVQSRKAPVRCLIHKRDLGKSKHCFDFNDWVNGAGKRLRSRN
jgi:hypothetical protein